MQPSKIKIIAIVGPTGSGKSDLAILLAKKFNGEIINADSRSIYKNCVIATASPSEADLKAVPHHLFNFFNPRLTFTAYDFKLAAEKVIQDVANRGKLPILVGGTGMYLDSLIENFQFEAKTNLELRNRLNSLSLEKLQEMLNKFAPSTLNESDYKNKRRLIRAIEVFEIEQKSPSEKKKNQSKYNCLWLGVKIDKEILRNRLKLRIDQMLEIGVLEETKYLYVNYKHDLTALTGIGYSVWYDYLEKKIGLDKAKQELLTQNWHLVKRQITWFKRNQKITWTNGNLEKAETLINDWI